MCYKIIINIVFCTLIFNATLIKCNKQVGPDPWDYESQSIKEYKDDTPPDLISSPNKKTPVTNNGIGDWFYRRLLAIILKGGDFQKQEDGSVEISLRMKVSKERWTVMEEYITFDTALTEDMFRRSMGYIEDSIYKPTITEKIAIAWSEYIQVYLIQYKEPLTWTLSFAAASVSILWLWKHLSHKHVIIMLLASLYLYEVFVSYKEAENQELEIFLKAVNTCKWFIWSSDCEVPPPDPLIFLKHMNPLKIAVRMFTTLISEPMLTINATIKIMVQGMTDGLWYPFDKIVYAIIVFMFNVLLIFLLILIMFNYILNIPFNLNFYGIIVGLKERNRTFPSDNPSMSTSDDGSVDRISERTLTRILNVCSHALNTAQTNQLADVNPMLTNMLTRPQKPKLKRLAKPGRSHVSSSTTNFNSKFKQIQFRPMHNGSGDA